MDWQRRPSGVSANTIRLVAFLILAGLFLVFRFLWDGWSPSLNEIMVTVGIVIALWLLGEWEEQVAMEKGQLRDAIDLIEKKLDLVLKQQKDLSKDV